MHEVQLVLLVESQVAQGLEQLEHMPLYGINGAMQSNEHVLLKRK
jgi:hypothetical protein